MKGTKNVVLLSFALGMMIYAVPRIHIGDGWTLPTIFGLVWLGFALLVVAAHLHEILGVDEERRRQMNRIKRLRRWQLEQLLRGWGKFPQAKK